jgi:hypothetical protein
MLEDQLRRDIYSALRREVEALSDMSREDLLKALPEGDQHDQWSNPLAVHLVCEAYLALKDDPHVLGVKVHDGVAECYAWENELAEECELVVVVDLPEELVDFLRRFDAGEYPELIRRPEGGE